MSTPFSKLHVCIVVFIRFIKEQIENFRRFFNDQSSLTKIEAKIDTNDYSCETNRIYLQGLINLSYSCQRSIILNFYRSFWKVFWINCWVRNQISITDHLKLSQKDYLSIQILLVAVLTRLPSKSIFSCTDKIHDILFCPTYRWFPALCQLPSLHEDCDSCNSADLSSGLPSHSQNEVWRIWRLNQEKSMQNNYDEYSFKL